MTQGFTPYSGGGYGNPPGGFAGTGTGETFGPSGGESFSTPSAPRARRATSQPVQYLVPSLVAGVVGLALNAFLVLGDLVATDWTWGYTAIGAWFVAGIVGVIALGWYFREQNKRRGAGFFSTVGWKKAVARLTYAVLCGAIIWSAVSIALWVSKW